MASRRYALTAKILLVAAPVAAQSRPHQASPPLPIETVLRAKRFGEGGPIRFSPDGRWLAYTVRDPGRSVGPSQTAATSYRNDVPWDAVGGDIWVTETKSRTSRYVLGGVADAWEPAWSPEGRFLAFLSDRGAGVGATTGDSGGGSHTRPWLWDLTSGSARLIADVQARGEPLLWSADGLRVLATLAPESTSAGTYARERTPRAGPGDDHLVPGATVTLYRSPLANTAGTALADPWSLDRPVDLAWIDVLSGAVRRVVRNTNLGAVRLSPDGRTAAYTIAKRFERAGTQQVLWDLVVLDQRDSSHLAAHDIRLSTNGRQFTWSPDGTSLAYRTAGMLASGDVYVVGLGGSPPLLVTGAEHRPFYRYASEGPLWGQDGSSLYFADSTSVWRAAADGGRLAEVARLADEIPVLLEQRPGLLWQLPNLSATMVLQRDLKGAGTGWCRIDLSTGRVDKVSRTGQFIGGYNAGYVADATDGVAVSQDGRQLVYAAQDVSHPPDLYLASAGTIATPRRLTQLNPAFDQYVMGERRIVAWRTVDGDTVRGTLLLPAGYKAGVRYPMLTKVYMGVPMRLQAGLFGAQSPAVDNLQLFATRGYAVFLPDIPVPNDGEMVRHLLKVVLPGVDRVVEMGIADAARLGVFGHSFGGYNTIALLTETTRFKAAMMNAGYADLMTSYGEMLSDGTAYGVAVLEHVLAGTPWEQPERYRENSPILHLDRVVTPLLIVHGTEDGAVAVYGADEVFVGLRRLGREVVYAKYQGESHHQEDWSVPNQLDYWRRVLEWFDGHLRKPGS
jgi:dipeptidyl aminopeptidase/acylaminoacyl peptidase